VARPTAARTLSEGASPQGDHGLDGRHIVRQPIDTFGVLTAVTVAMSAATFAYLWR